MSLASHSKSPRFRSFLGFKHFLAGSLILTLAPAPGALPAAVSQHRPKYLFKTPKPLTRQERAMHALNRLTFGTRPGDVERVESIGVDKWVEMQLNPEQIDDSSLQARLEDYPAMRLSQKALIEDFPSPALIRAAADKKIPLPHDRAERAIYQNQIADYEMRRQKQAEDAARQQAVSTPPAGLPGQKQGVNGGAMPAPATEGGMAPPMALADAASSPSMAVHEQKLFQDLASTQVVNLPPEQRLDKLLSMKPEEFRGFLRSLTPEERGQVIEGMTPQQREFVFALFNPTVLVAGELMQSRLLTDVYSQRQLQAVMADFWLNHFNVYLRKGPFAPWYLVDYQQNVIGPRAMGNFENLLVATARSPAMLFYLDNLSSVGPHSLAAWRAQMNARGKKVDLGLNENYARELMELHTLGVDGGYTQRDVTEVAKVFTGWTIDEPGKGGGFVFNERRHEPGPKYVLGHVIQDGGEGEGLEVLHLLATSPATAHHLSEQLAQRFVSDTPPASLVDRMASTYLRTGGDIREVLRTMFTSPEFWSRDAYRAKVKTPEEFVISAVRATGGDVVRPALVLGAMNELGMAFFGCQPPNGYSWEASSWVNTGDLLDRMNIALALAGQRLGTVVDLDALMNLNAPDGAKAAAKAAKLEEALLDGQVTPQTNDAVLSQVEQMNGDNPAALPAPAAKGAPGAGPGIPRRPALIQLMDLAGPIPPPADKEAAMAAGLLLGSPDFQRR